MSDNKECPKCGAKWIDGQHYWSGTGQLGNETKLADLVCDRFGDDQCINPAKGTTKGTGWESRRAELDSLVSDWESPE